MILRNRCWAIRGIIRSCVKKTLSGLEKKRFQVLQTLKGFLADLSEFVEPERVAWKRPERVGWEENMKESVGRESERVAWKRP